ncbi:DEKNAAC103524 [Brettanomyces naardenensis]|uniref:DEKNAAC103524 n=1 Tax=Brettanomyces naardenensis TaxID=13370 RepID=A0A448YNG6_BRENA|nr:DEKNAAC103524 [Brettanomyces naardenensis]
MTDREGSPIGKTQEMVKAYERLAAEAALSARRGSLKSDDGKSEDRSERGDDEDDGYDNSSDKLDTVHTDDCLPPDPPQIVKKYKLNADFNQRSPARDILEDKSNLTNSHDPSFQEWMPDVLKGEKWPERETIVNSTNEANENEVSSDYTTSSIGAQMLEDNPYLSVSARTNTIVKNSALGGDDEAEWRKYRNDQFVRHLNANNFKQPSTEDAETRGFVPDTFANKSRNKNMDSNKKNHSVLSESFTPSSPLKLFGGRQDTYTKGKLKDILGYVNGGKKEEAKQQNGTEDEEEGDISHVIKGADSVYDKAIASAKVAGELPDDSNGNGSSSMTYSEEYTSDADEFNSERSGATFSANAYYQNGDNLFKNLKRKFSQPLPRPSSGVSDYTSDEVDEEEVEEETTAAVDANEETTDGNLTSSLAALQKQFNISMSDLGGGVKPVSKPKIEGGKRNEEVKKSEVKPAEFSDHEYLSDINEATGASPKYKLLNFISAEDYKDKIYDKRQNKYISKDEYSELYGETNNEGVGISASRTNEDVFEGISGVVEKSSGILKHDSNIRNQRPVQEVSFKLPDEDTLDKHTVLPSDTTGELSFSQTNAALVSAITETYPEEDWDYVEQLVISEKHLDKLRDLKRFTPHMWLLDASHNQISHVEGVPENIQILKLRDNRFDTLAAFELRNLQVLELDENSLENLSGLSSLSNLSSLSVSSNRLINVDHLQSLRMLRYLNLSNNKLSARLDFANYQLWLLEDLILDGNQLTELVGIENLPNLIYLSANDNSLRSISCLGVKHKNLKRLSLNNNRLAGLELGCFPRLMRLSVDRNDLEQISGLGRYLEKVSFRYQSASDSVTSEIVSSSFKSDNLRSISLTGGSISGFNLLGKGVSPRFSTLTRLDLSAMGLDKLPDKFGETFPLLTDLNLNFNSLTSLKELKGLSHLRKLKLLGNSLGKIEGIMESTESLRESLRLLDLRVNPVTKGFYPYVFYDPESRNDGERTRLFEGEAASAAIGDSFVDGSSMLNLRDYDDIEAFSVEYQKLYSKDRLSKWSEKDNEFGDQQSKVLANEKGIYQMGLIVWFYNIQYLDGLKIDLKRRLQENGRFKRNSRATKRNQVAS